MTTLSPPSASSPTASPTASYASTSGLVGAAAKGVVCLQSVDRQWSYQLTIYGSPYGISFRISSASSMAAKIDGGSHTVLAGDTGYVLVVDTVDHEKRTTPPIVQPGDVVLAVNHQSRHNQNMWELEDMKSQLHKNEMAFPIHLLLQRPHHLDTEAAAELGLLGPSPAPTIPPTQPPTNASTSAAAGGATRDERGAARLLV